MHTIFRILLLLDWVLAAVWLWRVLLWRRKLRQLPDLAALVDAHPAHVLPSLSVIVPARNEAAAIAATLRSLLASEGVTLEILAVDDRSDDRTGAIMEELKAEWARPSADVTLKVLHVTDLPTGWLGKTHAMSLAAGQATGQWLLFTDGDVLFHPKALRRSLAFAIDSGADHMVLLPTILLRSAGERMMVAFLHVLSLFAVRLWRVPDPAAKRAAIGVGAFNLVRRDVYAAIGGWAALRLEIVEDIAIGRRIKSQGFAPRVACGLDLVRVRWAVGAFGVVQNTTKNLFAVFRFRPLWLLGAACGLGGFTLFPLAMGFSGPAAWWPPGSAVIGALSRLSASRQIPPFHRPADGRVSTRCLPDGLRHVALHVPRAMAWRHLLAGHLLSVSRVARRT